jgi:putative lipoic acid-binding regulatory protein
MEPERISFPSEYPIKVVARSALGLRPRLDAVFVRHFGDFPASRVTERPSAQSNFLALTYLMLVQEEAQLASLHTELKAISEVVLVL